MSLPGLANQPQNAPAPKQSFSVYTMMLIVAFIALVIGSVLLYQELNKYGAFPQWNVGNLNAPAAGS